MSTEQFVAKLDARLAVSDQELAELAALPKLTAEQEERRDELEAEREVLLVARHKATRERIDD